MARAQRGPSGCALVLSLLLVLLLLAACAAPQPVMLSAGAAASNSFATPAPEAASGYTPKPGWSTRTYAVAAAHPLAAQAGQEILQMGGSAVDAAIAVQMVLTLVEPQSSGIGGGAFLLHHDGKNVEAFDGRETAPSAVDETLFLDPQGKPLAFRDAMASGRAVGTPGVLRMLAMAHQRHGKLPWASLLAPAIQLSRAGFAVSARLHALLTQESALRQNAVAATYFFDAQGQPWPVGHVLKNPELAVVLERIAERGPNALHQGEIAQAIVGAVQAHPTYPGLLNAADLAGYRALQREPLCHRHQVAQRHYRICGMPPPSSGALATGQILGLLAHTPASALAAPPPAARAASTAPSAEWLHLYTEAARLAFADRAQYVADPDFVATPAGDWASLLAPGYLAQRAQLIGPRRMSEPSAGNPANTVSHYAPMAAQAEYGTSHVSVVDGYGNALALTTSIENAFGARIMVNRGVGLGGGFLLNNQLTDFSFAPTDANGKPIANRVQAAKRPRSSMSPTLVFDGSSGQLLMSLGSPGGAFIIHYNTKTLYAMLHWGLNAQAAIDLPNFGTLGSGTVQLEAGRFDAATVAALQARGHRVALTPLTSGLQALQRSGSAWFGGADPRREGVVLGD